MKRNGDGALLLLVSIAGAGTMVVELAAVRLLAPWFGASSAVWTNVIGVVLLALSLGYLLGARWSNSERPLQRLARTIMLHRLVVRDTRVVVKQRRIQAFFSRLAVTQ